jgi:cysteine desulfurase
MNIYLDNAATTAVDPAVEKAMKPFWSEAFANASSVHAKGVEAKESLAQARQLIAKSISAEPSEVIFTGSGTEANNLALKGLFFESAPEKNHIITSQIEHDCVLNACKWLESRGADVTYLLVDEDGFVNPDDVENAITDKTFIVSIIHGNNEIGTVQNISAIAKVCKKNEVLLHTDACQSYTKVSIDVEEMGVDLMTINAHKIHGPKGVGGLYVRKGTKIQALLHGGGQELNLRSSTENIPGIIGFAKAVEIASWDDVEKMKAMRNAFIERIEKVEGVRVNGARGDKRLANNINLSFFMIEGEQLQSELSKRGIYVSTGSACSSSAKDVSHVMKAIKCPMEYLHGNIRLSISKFTTQDELDAAFDAITEVIQDKKMQTV